MYCENCGIEIPEGAEFCPNCGNKIGKRHKNIYIALILTFILTGLGSIYAGNTKKGLILLAIRIGSAVIGIVANILVVFSILVWAYAFYAAYKDVQIANGHENPKLLDDFRGWSRNTRIVAVLIVAVIMFFTVAGCIGFLVVNNDLPDDSTVNYYAGGSGSSSSSSSHSSSHYGGVDDSPRSIVKNDPDWYYDHYEYGDNDKVDEYLESQGYD